MSGNRLAQILARALMGLGLTIGSLAMVLWLFDLRIEIPAWMWRVAVVKLTLASALGMLIVGAGLLRHLRRKEGAFAASVVGRTPDELLPAPNWEPSVGRESVPVEKRTPREPRTP